MCSIFVPPGSRSIASPMFHPDRPIDSFTFNHAITSSEEPPSALKRTLAPIFDATRNRPAGGFSLNDTQSNTPHNGHASAKRAVRRPWLLPVAPVSGLVSADADRLFAEAAHAAIAGDVFARDALYAAFEPRLEGSIRRCQRIWLGQSSRSIEDVIEPADIAQEAYLVFVNLVNEWRGDASVTAYICGQFAWRLSDAVRAWRPRRPGNPTESSIELVTDGSAEANEALAMVNALLGQLTESSAEMLRWRVVEGRTFQDIARLAGTSQRTVSRRWRSALDDVRRLGPRQDWS